MYFGFSPELNTAIDAGLAKYGPVELAKRFMFHYMRENGVTYGDAWQCVIELSESSFEDPTYFRKVEQIYAKYAEIMDEESAATIDEDIRITAKYDVVQSILGGAEDPISQLIYHICYSVKGFVGMRSGYKIVSRSWTRRQGYLISGRRLLRFLRLLCRWVMLVRLWLAGGIWIVR